MIKTLLNVNRDNIVLMNLMSFYLYNHNFFMFV